MKLFSYYKNAVIYPSLFVLFFSFINSILDLWLTDHTDFLMANIPSFLFCLLISVLSLPIFLNKIKKINTNLIWNILTWFVLPFFYIAMIFIHDINSRFKFEFGLGKDFLYLLIMTLPFVLGLIWTFIKYREQVSVIDTAQI